MPEYVQANPVQPTLILFIAPSPLTLAQTPLSYPFFTNSLFLSKMYKKTLLWLLL